MSPLSLSRAILGRLGDRTSHEGRRWLARAAFASVVASAAGVLAGIVPAAVELGVQGLTGHPTGAPLARALLSVAPGLASNAWAWVGLSFGGIVVAVGVALFSSETGARLAADTTASLRIAMMRAAVASSPRDLGDLGATLGGPPRPPGMAPPPARSTPGVDAVKLAVLRDSQSTAEFLVAGLVTLPQALFAIAALGVDLARSGSISVLIGGVAIFVVSRLFGLRASRGVAAATASLQATDTQVFSEVGEKLAHLEDFRLSGARQQADREVSSAVRAAAAARRRFARALSVSGQITSVLGAMAPLLVLAVLSVSGRTPSAGEVAKLLLAIPVVVARLQAIDALRVGSIEKAPVLANVSRVLALRPHPDPSRAYVGADRIASGAVRLEHVSFAPSLGADAILHDVSLDVPEGSVVGLCGPSGSGKSTILRLLLRLDDPSAGVVTVGGTDVREILVDELPRVFAVLGQQSRLLPRTIADNVTLGHEGEPPALQERARTALVGAQIPELAEAAAIERRFSPSPPNLSGGEQRRVLLARALARESRVLVLDEPEAGLPGGQVEAVLAAAVGASNGKTLIVATHAPDLLRSTFNVLLDGGRVVAVGTHDELLSTCAAYAKLFARRPSA